QAAQQRPPAAHRILLVHLVNLQENVLDHVLGIRRVPQDTPGRAEHERSVLAHDAIPVGHRLDLLIVVGKAPPTSYVEPGGSFLPRPDRILRAARREFRTRRSSDMITASTRMPLARSCLPRPLEGRIHAPPHKASASPGTPASPGIGAAPRPGPGRRGP